MVAVKPSETESFLRRLPKTLEVVLVHGPDAGLIDERCRASAQDVYGAGDVANHLHPVFGRVRVEHYLAGDETLCHDAEALLDLIYNEVVLREDESTEAGVREAEELMQRLGVQPSQLIDRAYVDLLAERRNGA